MVVTQRVAIRFMGNEDHADDNEDVAQFVQSIQDVVVPMEGRVFQRILVHGSRIVCFLHLIRVLLVFDMTMADDVSMRDPNLSTDPNKFIHVSLHYLSLARFTYFKVVVRGVVAAIIQARIVDRNHVHVFRYGVVRDEIAKGDNYLRRWFRVRRVISGRQAFPATHSLPASVNVP